MELLHLIKYSCILIASLLLNTSTLHAQKATNQPFTLDALHLGPENHSILNNTELTIEGAVVISANDGKNAHPINPSALDSIVLWVEKGIVTEDFNIVSPLYWADHVLSEEYKLPPLSEVKKFIAQNKHLPDIPSEQQIMDDGYALHKMNTLFLTKIEEMTLYILKLEEEIIQSNKRKIELLDLINKLEK